ncbi:hypothetical protein [Elizabethkingia anophelis]|uniref:Uncharacterized protein n=1 Tax=Elizabethkingia anophelis TaxID=1117645 RepID=A0AAU8UQ45_9FLAO|nr:hypothetical protein [Elizabethkingia anophelis]AQX00461.1 hypothetical protein BBD32_02760 [Elizabethkingia anophelis]OPB66229.1 hypothetical protein BAY11_14790 [Elizabethkingia anophelis]
MKTLEQIKDEVAKDFGYESFEKFDDKSTFYYDHKTPKIIDEISKRYALEVAQASLEKAAENANIKYHDGHNKLYKAVKHVQIGADNIQIDKESITNHNNITLL